MQVSLNFRPYNFNTKTHEGNTLIFDIIRKKYVRLTPEEWVRQNTIHFLIEELGVPSGLISVERSLSFNGLQKRFDICCAANSGAMKLLVECKAPSVEITQKAIYQAAVYQKVLNTRLLMLTNGINHFYFHSQEEGKAPVRVPNLPPYSQWT